MTDHTVDGVTGVYPSELAVTCSWFTLRSARWRRRPAPLSRSGPKSTPLAG